MKKIENTKTIELATVENNATKTNENATDIVMLLRGNNSIGVEILSKKYGLTQLSSRNNDTKQLIFNGGTSINVRTNKPMFLNCTDTDFELFINHFKSKLTTNHDNTIECEKFDNIELHKCGNLSYKSREHRVLFTYNDIDTICNILVKNKLNLIGCAIL